MCHPSAQAQRAHQKEGSLGRCAVPRHALVPLCFTHRRETEQMLVGSAPPEGSADCARTVYFCVCVCVWVRVCVCVCVYVCIICVCVCVCVCACVVSMAMFVYLKKISQIGRLLNLMICFLIWSYRTGTTLERWQSSRGFRSLGGCATSERPILSVRTVLI